MVPKQMKAVIFEQYGDAEVLKYTDFRVPTPERGEALVKVHAVSLNGYDLVPAVRADLLRRLGRHDAAREAYLAASAATQLEPLRRLYARRIAGLDGGVAEK